MMEHYSKDKMYLRVLNSVVYFVFIIMIVSNIFFNFNESIINIILESDYFNKPFIYTYLISLVALVYLLLFILAQLDSSSYGTKKRVIENYGFLVFFSFLSTIVWYYSLISSRLKLSLMFAVVSTIIMTIVYIKSHLLQKYLYTDETRVFVVPFSIYLSTFIMFLFFIANTLIVNEFSLSTYMVLGLSVIEIIIVTTACILCLIFFKDVYFVAVQLLYLIGIGVECKIRDTFMPIGYICFLSIIIIMVVLYKTFKKKKQKERGMLIND